MDIMGSAWSRGEPNQTVPAVTPSNGPDIAPLSPVGRNGCTVARIGGPLVQQWRAAMPGVAGVTAYFGSWGSYEYAVDAVSGALRRTFLE
jgi:hypothetical protein